MFERKQVSRQEVMLSVTGSLTAETSVEFHGQLQALAAGDSSVITLDLSRTESVCSPALGKILLFKKKLAEQQRTLQIRGCNETLYATFQMINFSSLISIER